MIGSKCIKLISCFFVLVSILLTGSCAANGKCTNGNNPATTELTLNRQHQVQLSLHHRQTLLPDTAEPSE